MNPNTRRYLRFIIPVAVLGIWALAIDVPHLFAPETTISSSEVNENFDALAGALTTFEDAIVVDDDGNVGIGTGSPGFQLDVVGGMLATDDDRAIIGRQGTRSCAGTYGVGGCATTGNGVVGRAGGGIGVLGVSDTRGVVGTQGETSCAGSYAVGGCGTTDDGIYGRSRDGRAGVFDGTVQVNGNLIVSGTKNFRIDHPLDPDHRYLQHFAVESNEVLNVYSGTAGLGTDGTAVIRLPDYFEALNTDVRYQLTPIGAAMPNLHVSEKVSQGRFAVAGGVPGADVSWQVTAVRNDAGLRGGRPPVELDKPASERGGSEADGRGTHPVARRAP